MKEYKLTAEKTARYFTLGKLDDTTKSIWIVIHGYGQLAKYFLNKFKCLNNGSMFVAAPEALSKFYLKGFSGRVGATWMTKEARETEIADNIKYLQSFYDEITKGKELGNCQINVLGFSQGTKTASRWILNSNIKIDNLILWGGSLPPDTDFEFHKERLASFKLHLVIGNEDEFITDSDVKNGMKFLNNKNVKYLFHPYNGKHDIDIKAIFALINSLK